MTGGRLKEGLFPRDLRIAVLPAAVLLAWAPAGLLAQTLTHRSEAVAPLAPDHELREYLELAHLRGEIRLPAMEVRAVRAGDLALVERGRPAQRGWTERFGHSSLPPPLAPETGESAFGTEFRIGGRWGDELLDPGDGLHFGVEGRARIRERFGFGISVDGGGYEVYDGLRELLVTGRVAGVVLTAGRWRPRHGPGRDDLLLPGTHPVDGVGLETHRPFLLPGPLSRAGPVSFSTSVHRADHVGVVESPWYGTLAFSLDPGEGFRVGASRTVVFGGEGLPPVTGRRLFRLLTGRHSVDEEGGEFEDQYAQVFTRVRFGVADRPVALYASLAFNDTEGAFRDDPGFLAGILLSAAPPGWDGLLRYEYVAFGPRARICFFCDVKRERFWFNHFVFGPHQMEGLPMGSSLAGKGARHLVRWRGWSDGARWSVEAELFAEVREGENLLMDRWPGKRRGAGVGVAHYPWDPVRVGAFVGTTQGPDLPWRGQAELTLSWVGLQFPAPR